MIHINHRAYLLTCPPSYNLLSLFIQIASIYSLSIFSLSSLCSSSSSTSTLTSSSSASSSSTHLLKPPASPFSHHSNTNLLTNPTPSTPSLPALIINLISVANSTRRRQVHLHRIGNRVSEVRCLFPFYLLRVMIRSQLTSGYSDSPTVDDYSWLFIKTRFVDACASR